MESSPLLEMQEHLDRFTEYVNILKERSNKDKIKELSKLRGFSMKVIEDHDIFWIGEMSEMLVPDFLDELQEFGVISETNHKPIFHHRWVMPIKNEEGKVINLVGYSNEADERYVYGTGKYYSRTDTLFGLENLNEAYRCGWAIITEGITDTISVRGVGYKNTFAMCGTRPSDYKMRLLNRLRYGVIFIHDRDKPGDGTRKHWVVNRYFRFNTPIKYKDADATLHDPEQDNTEWFKNCMDMAIAWIKEREHKGYKCPCQEDTMM